jgi:hypothetical protein
MGALALSNRALNIASRRAIEVPSRARIAPARPVSVREQREFPEASTRPTLPATISDELVEFYAFVFCQGGFRQLDMTFEQFLLVAAVIKPFEPRAGLESAVHWGGVVR